MPGRTYALSSASDAWIPLWSESCNPIALRPVGQSRLLAARQCKSGAQTSLDAYTSTLITSNRDTDELARLFGDPLLASAAMDRLLHAAHVLRLQGDTYRNPRTPRKGNHRKNNQPEVTT